MSVFGVTHQWCDERNNMERERACHATVRCSQHREQESETVRLAVRVETACSADPPPPHTTHRCVAQHPARPRSPLYHTLDLMVHVAPLLEAEVKLARQETWDPSGHLGASVLIWRGDHFVLMEKANAFPMYSKWIGAHTVLMFVLCKLRVVCQMPLMASFLKHIFQNPSFFM